jgi:hypothetical protein
MTFGPGLTPWSGPFFGFAFRIFGTVLVLPTDEGSKRMARDTVKNHWFVSVEMPKRSAQTSARRTETFPTETDAKQFAKEVLSKKRHRQEHRIVAGTLLGAYLPVRRIISGSQLFSWVGEEESQGRS